MFLVITMSFAYHILYNSHSLSDTISSKVILTISESNENAHQQTKYSSTNIIKMNLIEGSSYINYRPVK